MHPFVTQRAWTILALLVVATSLFGQNKFVKVEISTEDKPQFLQWRLYDNNDVLLHSYSEGYQISNHTYTHLVDVPENTCFRFQILYSQGNTFTDSGGYKLFYNDELLITGNDLWFEENHNFNCSIGQSCNTAIPIEVLPFTNKNINNTITWYTIVVRQTDVYNISTCASDGSETNVDTELFVYDNCGNAFGLIGPEGTVSYSDDGFCSPQSTINSLKLLAGRVYYFKVKSKNTNINTCTYLNVELDDYAYGCTNSEACNFDIFASIDDGSCYVESCLPDLVVSQDRLVESIHLDSIDNTDECMVEEGCLQGMGKRHIVRFTTHIRNIGDADYIVGSPEDNPIGYSNDNCHRHWHKLGYAEYLLYKGSGQPVPIGFKNGFCVLDLSCDDANNNKFSCDYMGITAGCADTYDASMGCQWIDVTEIPDGMYTLVLRINWDRVPDIRGFPESNYDNNWAQACLRIDRSSGEIKVNVMDDCEEYTDCLGKTFGQTEVDCAGVCGGNAHYGDINGDGLIKDDDIELFLQELTDNDIVSSPCYDLFPDNKKTIYDLLLLWQCYQSQEKDKTDNHVHCKFPTGYHNPEHTVSLKISNLNTNYFDIEYIANCEVTGLSFSIDGVAIDKVERLGNSHNPNEYVVLSGDKIHTAFLHEDGYLPIQSSYHPFLRVYYDGMLDNKVCIKKVEEAIDAEYGLVTGKYVNDCLEENTVSVDEEFFPDVLDVYPNPVKNLLHVDVILGGHSKLQVSVFDLTGKEIVVPQSSSKKSDFLTVTLSTSKLVSGSYVLRTSIGEEVFVEKISIID